MGFRMNWKVECRGLIHSTDLHVRKFAVQLDPTGSKTKLESILLELRLIGLLLGAEHLGPSDWR